MSKSKPETTSSLTFTGISDSGHILEAIKDAIKQASEAIPPGGEGNAAWTVESIGGNKITPEPIFVKIRIYPGEGEGGIGPKFTRGSA